MKNRTDWIARISDLTHRYGDTTALDTVNLEIPAGQMVGFIGPDGVGKSSLLAIVSGVRKIQTGSVEVLGGNMADKRHREGVLMRIAYMPQGLGKNLYPTLSVFENVDFFGRLFGQPGEEREYRIKELLVSTGLAPFADRAAGKLSGGMKQKLGLCCALIHDPDLLILDEPTTGVDPLFRRQFWELIDRIRSRRKGMSVLIATAYMEEAESFDWLVAMDAGRILATGSPEELKLQNRADNLEGAFINLLPEEKRRSHRTLIIPPRQSHGEEVAIEAKGLTKRFGSFSAVDHVNFRIERGEIFGFLGSNGCGKTTTMKMLTGLLPISEGEAWLFGKLVDANDIETRKGVGYMSQGFSLYEELTVRQNLELHARLFHLPNDQIPERINEMIKRFGLDEFVDELPEKLPLGIRQRLSLAVAVIHGPEMLILDEPTSGVDPVARDAFWEFLIDLSRNQGVTVFISTHFMNEAERCDRISLMHEGKVLAQDSPQSLIHVQGAKSLEGAFISYLKDATTDMEETPEPEASPVKNIRFGPGSKSSTYQVPFGLRRLWAYALRETMEVRRDPIRLAFALLGPIILMVAFGYGISFDVEHLSFAVLDHDRSSASRNYIENFQGSRYFEEQEPILDHAELESRMRSGKLKVAIEIPPNFGKDLKRGRRPEVGVWLDGAMPFRAEISRGYVQGVHQAYVAGLNRREQTKDASGLPANIETRFRYNQDFKSVFAMVPGTIMMLLILIPAMMTALGVVREKELGSIINFYVTPVTKAEFLLGKQIPYVFIALISFISLMMLALFLFRVPVKGNFVALVSGAFLYVIAATGFGILVSTFVKTQLAAMFATIILSMLPVVLFSGLINPVSSLSSGARIMGYAFPSTYFQQISVGTFTKALGFPDLAGNYLALTVIILVYLLLSIVFLKKQER